MSMGLLSTSYGGPPPAVANHDGGTLSMNVTLFLILVPLVLFLVLRRKRTGRDGT